jgi:hypothetical protein
MYHFVAERSTIYWLPQLVLVSLEPLNPAALGNYLRHSSPTFRCQDGKVRLTTQPFRWLPDSRDGTQSGGFHEKK